MSGLHSRLGLPNFPLPVALAPAKAPAAPARDYTPDEWFRSFGLSGASVTGVHVSQSTSMAATAVMAAVTMLAEDVAKLPPRLYRKDAKGRKQEAIDHPLAALLEAPNEWQNWLEFCEQLQVGLILRGNGYAVIIRNARGIAVRLVPLNPDWVALWVTPDGGIFYHVRAQDIHVQALLRGLPQLIPAEDMFHLRGFSQDGLTGASRIRLAREAIALSIAQEQEAARWMGNGSKPSGVLTTDQKLSPDAAKRIAADWKDMHSGLQNSGQTAVLEQGLTWTQLSMTSSDLEFIASRKFQIEEIARIFRIPLHMLASLDRSTNNNIVQQSQEYVNYTLVGYTERWERKLASVFDLRRQGLFIEHDMSSLLRADVTSRFNIYRIGIMSMIMTPNEARLDAGYDPSDDPEADKLQRPQNMAAVGSQSSGTKADGGGRPAGDETVVN